jgi:hypothetical protein
MRKSQTDESCGLRQIAVSWALCIITQGSPVEIQASTQWNLIGRSMTAPLPVLMPSIILPLPSSLGTSITAKKTQCALQKSYNFNFIFFINTVSQTLRNIQLRQTVPVYCNRTFPLTARPVAWMQETRKVAQQAETWRSQDTTKKILITTN